MFKWPTASPVPARARVRAHCSPSMLSAGNARVTARNYEDGVRGGALQTCSGGGGGVPRLPPPLPRFAAACQVLPRSGGRSAASEWNVPSRFKVQSPEGPKDHLRPPTCPPPSLFLNSLSSAAPALLLAAHQSNSRR